MQIFFQHPKWSLNMVCIHMFQKQHGFNTNYYTKLFTRSEKSKMIQGTAFVCYLNIRSKRRGFAELQLIMLLNEGIQLRSIHTDRYTHFMLHTRVKAKETLFV